MRSFVSLLPGVALLVCCTSPPTPRFASDGDAALTQEGLRAVERAGFQRAWMRPGVSFRGYDRIWLRYRDIAYRRPPGRSRGPVYGRGGDNYALSDALRTRVSEDLREIFTSELAHGAFRRAEGRGPGVLDVRIGLIDLVVHQPLDVRAGDDNIYVDSVASVTILVDLHDSESGVLIGRLAERAGIAPASGRPIQAAAGPAVYETRRLLASWATRLRALLHAIRSADLSS